MGPFRKKYRASDVPSAAVHVCQQEERALGGLSELRSVFWGASAPDLGTWVGLTLAGVFGDEHGNRVKLVIIALHLTRHEEIRVCGGGGGRGGGWRMMEGGEMVNQAKGKKEKEEKKRQE